MKPPLREVMTVIWQGSQVPGLTFYGLCAAAATDELSFPMNAWPDEPEWNHSWLQGLSWRVLVWDVALGGWPSAEQLLKAVRSTLGTLIDGGCKVAWVGREGYFCDPPELFSTDCMSGGVLAASLPDGRFWCHLDPDAPLSPLPDDVLRELRSAAPGLADAK